MWDFRDAWILQAIVTAARPRRLSDVIAAADYINVDIPSREDLERSVNRLMAAELVIAEGNNLRPTRQGRRLVRRAGTWRARVRELPPLIEAELRSVSLPDGNAGWELSEDAWRDAYDAYYPLEKRSGS